MTGFCPRRRRLGVDVRIRGELEIAPPRAARSDSPPARRHLTSPHLRADTQRLNHHRIRRQIDPAAGSRIDTEAALTQLRDAQPDVTGLRRQQPGPGAVAFGHPGARFVRSGRRRWPRRPQLDQVLQHQLHPITDQIDPLAENPSSHSDRTAWDGVIGVFLGVHLQEHTENHAGDRTVVDSPPKPAREIA